MFLLLLCSDLEPEWIDNIQKNGELFYLELSEGEEEAALVQATNQAPSANHVHFSEKEAEVITEDSRKQQCGPRGNNQPTLKRLARMLKKKHQSSQRKAGRKDEANDSRSSAAPPMSILKNQPGQKPGMMVQQPQLKDVCVYLNPKRLGGSATAVQSSGGLLEMLLGIKHCPSWGNGEAAAVSKEEVLTVHGLIPNSPATKCGQILIGKIVISLAGYLNTLEMYCKQETHHGVDEYKQIYSFKRSAAAIAPFCKTASLVASGFTLSTPMIKTQTLRVVI